MDFLSEMQQLVEKGTAVEATEGKGFRAKRDVHLRSKLAAHVATKAVYTGPTNQPAVQQYARLI